MRQDRLQRNTAGLLAGFLLLLGMASVQAADGQDEELIRRVVGAGGIFDFTKLDQSGSTIDDQDAVYTVKAWSCVRDNVTGLTWEVKTIDGGLRDQNHTYSWYNPDSEVNAGAPGRQDGGSCSGVSCDTTSYAQAVNDDGLCGHSDWRMPTRAELRTIVDYQATRPAISTEYFPNTVSRSFWTGEANETYPNFAWHTDFKFGLASYYFLKSAPKPVRLVREASGEGEQ